METNFPTVNADITVPMPTPFNLWKKMKDKSEAIIIRVTSKITLILPKSACLAWEIAFTIPSPGTIITSGATSMLIPKARMMHPMKRLKILVTSISGENQERAHIPKSIKELKTKLTGICRNWIGKKSFFKIRI